MSTKSPIVHVRGTTTPKGLMWGRHKQHFFDIHGRLFSRSMVEEAGFGALGSAARLIDEKVFAIPEQRPGRIQTWGEQERERRRAEISVVNRDWTPPGSGSTTAVNTPSTEQETILGDWGKMADRKAEAKLEEPISVEDLPDVLIVHDFDAQLPLMGDRVSFEVRYRLTASHKRAKKAYDTEAYLSLRSTQLPSSRDCKIYEASFRLPGYPDALLVHVKVASGGDLPAATLKLQREAALYETALPAFFSEHWTGYHHMPEFEYDHRDGILAPCALAPKFYGYYTPEGRVDSLLLSPILITEDCGVPADVKKLSVNDRATLYSFTYRLHRHGIVHNELELGNVRVQPGPLHRAPSQRSMETPSFRLINFENAILKSQYTGNWKALCHEEVEDAKEMIYGGFGIKSKPLKKSGYEVITRKYWTHHKAVHRYVQIR